MTFTVKKAIRLSTISSLTPKCQAGDVENDLRRKTHHSWDKISQSRLDEYYEWFLLGKTMLKTIVVVQMEWNRNENAGTRWLCWAIDHSISVELNHRRLILLL